MSVSLHLRARVLSLAGVGLIGLVNALSTTATRADGALAIGTTGDIAKDGLAIGRSWNYKTKSQAEEMALKECRNFKDAPQRTRDRCRLISTFRNECVAAVIDPKAGTPGAGWAVAGNSEVAAQRAMAACKATAGKGREDYCEKDEVKCDGDAK